MKLSQSNFNLRSPDSDLVRSYLIATVTNFKESSTNYKFQFLYPNYDSTALELISHFVVLAGERVS